MKPPKKPLTLFAVVCKDDRDHEVDRLLSTARSRVTRYDKPPRPLLCGPHRIVKLVEEVRK